LLCVGAVFGISILAISNRKNDDTDDYKNYKGNEEQKEKLIDKDFTANEEKKENIIDKDFTSNEEAKTNTNENVNNFDYKSFDDKSHNAEEVPE
jgi:hypothetical protein